MEEDLRPGELTQMREEKKRKELLQEAQYLLDHFNRKTLDALVRCTRSTLESIKRRVSSPSALLYGESAEEKRKTDHRPAFKVNLMLAIPNISLKPTLEDMQGTLNNVVQQVIGIHKGVYRWGHAESTPTAVSSIAQIATQSQVLAASSGVLGATSGVISPSKKLSPHETFFKSVSEHKDMAKMVSMLSSTISSAKTLLTRSWNNSRTTNIFGLLTNKST